MCTLNSIGAEISALKGLVALTDVTGFGLLGHLGEICEASKISATIKYENVPLLANTKKYLAMDCIPGGTLNNFKSYGHTIEKMTKEQEIILCDAQTSGGLLAIVEKESVPKFLEITAKAGLDLQSIGETRASTEKLIKVI